RAAPAPWQCADPRTRRTPVPAGAARTGFRMLLPPHGREGSAGRALADRKYHRALWRQHRERHPAAERAPGRRLAHSHHPSEQRESDPRDRLAARSPLQRPRPSAPAPDRRLRQLSRTTLLCPPSSVLCLPSSVLRLLSSEPWLALSKNTAAPPSVTSNASRRSPSA